MLGEIFAIILMLVGSYVLIRFMAWVLTNKDEALRVPGKENSPAEKRGGTGASGGRGVSVRSNQEGTPTNQRPLDRGH